MCKDSGGSGAAPPSGKEVRVGGGLGPWLAVVISSDDEGVSDHKRSSDAWGALLGADGLSVGREVRLVYTLARAGGKALEAQAAP